jgi:predicted glycosyltransferase
MNILINTGHPAQVHNFKCLKSVLEKQGHTVFWLASDKDISKYLLKCYDIDYGILPRPGKSLYKKISLLLKNTFFAVQFIRKHKIDLAVSRVSPYICLAAFLTGTPHIALTDTETAGLYDSVFGRLASAVLTAKSFQRTLRKDQIRFDGNIELFYLHPKRFQPNPAVLDMLGVKKGDPYVIMRFVSWDAYHDKGLSGFTDANKIKAVKAFSRHARVFISAENRLPPELEPYQIKLPPEMMHDALAYAGLFFGEAATMASESAILGTLAIYLNDNWLGYTNEEADYGLLFNFKSRPEDQENAIAKGVELLADSDTRHIMEKNQQTFLSNKIDVTGFMVWFVENYPESFRIMRENPDYQYRFK